MFETQLYSGVGALLGRRIFDGQAPGAFRYLGNSTSFEMTPKIETYKHRSNRVVSRPVDYVLNHSAEVSCKFSVEDFSLGNLAMEFLGKEFSQASATITAKAIATDVVVGQFYDLGSPFAVVTSVEANAVPLASTDYVVHQSGIISFKANHTGPATWSGTTSATVDVSAMADTSYKLELIFDGLSAFGSEPLIIRTTAVITPGDAVQFLSTETVAQSLTITGECVWDDSINGGLAPGFARITRKAAA